MQKSTSILHNMQPDVTKPAEASTESTLRPEAAAWRAKNTPHDKARRRANLEKLGYLKKRLPLRSTRNIPRGY
jgi:hypothetical protein